MKQTNLTGEVQEMVFAPHDFDGESEMWQHIAQFEGLLLKAGYEFTVRTDGCAIIIQYGYDRELDYGNYIPMWVDPLDFENYEAWKADQTEEDKNT